MRVLIVGSTSVIGAAVGADLSRAGMEVDTAGRSGPDLRIDLADPGRSTGWRETLLRSGRYDVVINCAAAIGGPDQEALVAHRVNVEGARLVAELAALCGAERLIHFSTIYVGCPDRYPGPASYPATKAAGDRELEQLSGETDLSLTLLRPTHVYDTPGRCRPNQELPYLFAELAAAGRDIQVHGSGLARRDYLHLDDLVAAVRQCVVKGVTGTLELGSPQTMNLMEIATAAQTAFDSPGAVLTRPDLPDPPDLPELDGTGWRRLGLRPEIDMAAGFSLMRAAGGR